jgi:CTP:phosphocholine cytidylyltransferase-like protein
LNIFYVYLHRRLTDNKVFYVGKGHAKRAWIRSNRNRYWNNVVEKHGYSVEIVFENLTEDDAFKIEKDTILEMRYFGFPLVNMTDGGEGSWGA